MDCPRLIESETKRTVLEITHFCGHKEEQEIDYISQWDYELAKYRLEAELCWECQARSQPLIFGVKFRDEGGWASAVAFSRAMGLPPMETQYNHSKEDLPYLEAVRVELLPFIGQLISRTNWALDGGTLPAKTKAEMRMVLRILSGLPRVTDCDAWRELDSHIGEIWPGVEDERNWLLRLLAEYLMGRRSDATEIFDLALKLAEEEGEK